MYIPIYCFLKKFQLYYLDSVLPARLGDVFYLLCTRASMASLLRNTQRRLWHLGWYIGLSVCLYVVNGITPPCLEIGITTPCLAALLVTASPLLTCRCSNQVFMPTASCGCRMSQDGVRFLVGFRPLRLECRQTHTTFTRTQLVTPGRGTSNVTPNQQVCALNIVLCPTQVIFFIVTSSISSWFHMHRTERLVSPEQFLVKICMFRSHHFYDPSVL